MARNPSPAWTGRGDVPVLRYALERVRGVAKPPIAVTDPPADVVIERDVEVPTFATERCGSTSFVAPKVARPVVASIHPFTARTPCRGKMPHHGRMLRQPKPLGLGAGPGRRRPGAWRDRAGLGHADQCAAAAARQAETVADQG